MRNGLDDDGQMMSGDKHALNFLTFVLQLRENPGKNLNQETDPTGIWTRARWMRDNNITPRPQRWSFLFFCLCLRTISKNNRKQNFKMFKPIFITVCSSSRFTSIFKILYEVYEQAKYFRDNSYKPVNVLSWCVQLAIYENSDLWCN